MSDGRRISTWVPAQTKARFAALARQRGLSESALMKRLLEQALVIAEGGAAPSLPEEARLPRSQRLSIRLVPGDRVLLRERAAARSLAAASYVSLLIRAHLRAVAPLPTTELRALRECVAELAAIGRNLNQWVRSGGEAAHLRPGNLQVMNMLKLCESLRDHVRALMRTNLHSWQCGHGDEKP
ncbi:hypothetical protein [Povalibacter sp.]|uniref:hypothetical protein n=1 Tax=Povalibacter sp. TaxID=1962978 RepID=UPI002F4178E5